MRTVHKFSLDIGYTLVEMPENAKIIHVGEQYGQLQLWAEVDPNEPQTHRHFRVYGTGHPIDDVMHLDVQHIGTAIMQGGDFVAHIYEATAQPEQEKQES